MTVANRPNACKDEARGCQGTSFDRREFIKLGVLRAAAGLERDAMAVPFTIAGFDKLVPKDKKLAPEWVNSLTEWDTPTVYRGEGLKYIGMPVGGICGGQLYLGGDGRPRVGDRSSKSEPPMSR